MTARGLVHSARSDLIWWLIAFAVFQAGLAIAVERSLRDVRDPEYAVKRKRLRARRQEAPERPLVLVLGSSRTRLGLKPGELGVSSEQPAAVLHNFGMLGAGPMFEMICLRRLLADGLHPDLLFLEVVPMSLNQRDGPTVEENWLDGGRLATDEMLRLYPYYHDPERLLKGWCHSRFLPCVRHQVELKQQLRLDVEALPGHVPDPYGVMDVYGWQPTHVDVTPEQRRGFTANALRQYEATLSDFELAASPAQAIREILDLCRREGIAAAILLMPEGTPFRQRWTVAMTNAVGGYFAGLQREYGVPLIDARTWVADEGFWDAHHLLPAGASVFTERFGREALTPLLRSLPPRKPRATRF